MRVTLYDTWITTQTDTQYVVLLTCCEGLKQKMEICVQDMCFCQNRILMRALGTPVPANCTESRSGPYGTSPGTKTRQSEINISNILNSG